MFNPFDIFNVFKFGNLSAVVKRNFTELASIGSQHYTIPSVTLSGDFEIEVELLSSQMVNNTICSAAANDNSSEITKLNELYDIQGLNQSNPMTVTPTSKSAGDIDLAITGDGETTATVTRQP
jgi:hypothetical protein